MGAEVLRMSLTNLAQSLVLSFMPYKFEVRGTRYGKRVDKGRPQG